MRTLLRARHLVLFSLLFAIPAASHAQVGVGVAITVAPPALPVYEQPPCPTEGFLWTPGYWGYGLRGYYWIPGVWVAPPRVGVLWTPGYWGFGAAFTVGTRAIGGRTSDSTVELITASATAASVSGADDGKAATSFTTRRRGT